MIVSDIQPHEHDEYASYYLDLVPRGGFDEELQRATEPVLAFFAAIPPHL